MADEVKPATSKNRSSLSIDYRVISVVLLAVIAAMLLIWRPWQDTSSANEKTIEVTGQAKESATPDQFTFYPTYQFDGVDKQKSLDQLGLKSDELVAKLKSLGVSENKIKADSNNYGPVYKPMAEDAEPTTYTLTLTVEVSSQALAQKVQDYLVTTSPTGAISPQPSFSDAKRKELESKARDAATKDARSKANQTAQNLGTKVKGVKKVSEGGGFGGPELLTAGSAVGRDASAPKLGLHPGENELTYTVTVTFIIH